MPVERWREPATGFAVQGAGHLATPHRARYCVLPGAQNGPFEPFWGPFPQPSSLASTSYASTAAATAALRLSARPFIGSVTLKSQAAS
jgi:hypothetical protein